MISTVFSSIDLFMCIIETVLKRNLFTGTSRTSRIPSVYSPEDSLAGGAVDTDIELVSKNPMLGGMTTVDKSKHLESSIKELLKEREVRDKEREVRDKEREVRDKELEGLIEEYHKSLLQQQQP